MVITYLFDHIIYIDQYIDIFMVSHPLLYPRKHSEYLGSFRVKIKEASV